MDHDKDEGGRLPLSASARGLTGSAFAMLGVGEWAYIKPTVNEGVAAYAVHAADGRPLATIESRDLAIATVRRNELEPLSLH